MVIVNDASLSICSAKRRISGSDSVDYRDYVDSIDSVEGVRIVKEGQ